MNIMKNMELVFVVALALACSASMVLGADPQGTQTAASAECATHSVALLHMRAKSMTQ